MWNELKALEKQTEVESADIDGRVRLESHLKRQGIIGHFKIRCVIYLVLMAIFLLMCFGGVYAIFTETIIGGFAVFGIFISLAFFILRLFTVDEDLLRHYRAVVVGVKDKHLWHEMAKINHNTRNQLDRLVDQKSQSWSEIDSVTDVMQSYKSLPSLETVSNETNSKFHFGYLKKLLLRYDEIVFLLEETVKKQESSLENALYETRTSRSKSLDYEAEADTAKKKIDGMKTSLHSVEGTLLKREEEVKKLKSDLASQKKIISDLRLQTKDKKNVEKELINTRNSHYKFVQELKADLFSKEVPSTLIRELNKKLKEEHDPFVSVDDTEAALLYATMNEKHPDMKRVKELSLIPHEAIRAQQVQTIIDRYSSLIVAANKDEDLPEEEREDKINAYRMARESELQNFHGGA